MSGAVLPLCNGSPDAGDAYPLTALQQGMLYHSLATGDAGVYVQQFVGDLAEDLETEAFHRAWQWLAARHEVLRTRFVWSDESSPQQVVGPDVPVPWCERDWRHLSAWEQEAELDAFLEADRRRGVDLATAPLFRVALLRLRQAHYRFVWTSHHAILDGRSRLRLVEELFEGYAALRAGRQPALPPATPFREFVSQLQERDPEADAAFWGEVLRQHDPPQPLDLPRAAGSPARPTLAKKTARVTEALSRRLASFAQAEGLTLNTLLQGAWAILLSRYTGQRSVIFGAIRAGRAAASESVANAVGLLINTVPIPVDVDPDAALVPWLRSVRSLWLAMRDHEHTPLVEMNACLPPSRGPLEFDSLVTFEKFELNARLRERGDPWYRRTFTLRGQTNYPLVVYGYGGERLILEIEHDTARVEDAIAERLLDQLQTVLTEFVDRPDQQLAEISLLTAAERRRLLEDQHATCVAYPRTKCVHQLFEEQVARTPHTVAVVDGDRHVSYQELNARANRLAHHLRALGVSANTPVGVCMDRSLELIVALLGILKAGAAYLPLDPDYPAERLELMVRDGQVDVVLTRGDCGAHLPSDLRHVVALDAGLGVANGDQTENLPLSTTADDLAYVLYTSGSTGRPKGVAVRHRSIARLLFGVDYAVLDADQVMLQLAPISFDASTFEIWGALLHGGRLVLAPAGPPDLEQLGELIVQHGISTLWLTAALFNRLVETHPESLSGVQQILTGGEALSVPHVRRALEYLGEGAKLVNGYGPTECTTFTCCYDIPHAIDPDQPSIPIGRPIANTEVFVLDERLRLVPAGVPGELCVGGDGLALGYWRNPELTAARFVPHPFSAESGARLYRTGDRVRWRSDGNLEFLGRQDDQVKLRGYRIELGEIEHALQRHEGVAQGVVALREDRPGHIRLVGYYVASNGPLRSTELKAHLSSILPQYMVPSVLVQLDALPLSPSGKVDRRSLPAPDGNRAEPEGRPVAARTPVEETLCAIWADVLGLADVGVHDDFFDLGGHSLLATQAVARASRALNVAIRLSTLFDAPTVAEFAAGLPDPATDVSAAPAARIARVDREGTADLPLSFAQQGLWFTEQVMGEAAAYNMPYVVRLRGPLEVEALRRALETLVHRHEPLRTNVRVGDDGAPRPLIRPPERFELSVADLEAGGLHDPEAEVDRRSAEEAARPFDLAADLMLRAVLLRLGEHDHALLLTTHHIASDGWSVAIMWRELSGLYDAYCRGEGSPLPELPVRYADFAAWQRDQMRGDRAERLLEYWRDALRGAPPVLDLPMDQPRPERRSYLGGQRVAELPSAITERLRALGMEERATLFMVLLSAFQVVLHRWSGQEDFVIGVPVAGRPVRELEELMGLFINSLPLRAHLAGDPTLRELVGRVRQTTLEAYSHQELPFEMLVEALRPERSLMRAPLFQVAFNAVGVDDLSWTATGVTAEISSSYARSKFDFTVYVRERASQIELKLVYDADLFSPERMDCLLRQYGHVLGQIARWPDERISTYSLVTPECRRLLPDPREELSEPRQELVTHAFARWADRFPNQPAVVQAERVWTYADLRESAAGIAGHLRASGVEPGDRIVVSGRSSFGVIASIVAVLDCGGILVLLDERLPLHRRQMMAREVEPRAAIRVSTGDDEGDLTFPEIPIVDVDTRTGRTVAPPRDGQQRQSRSAISPESPAYIFFTSGTTGVPKGILGSHKGLSHFLEWQREVFEIHRGDRVAQLTGLSFDVVLRDVFLPLTSGATLCLPMEDVEESGGVWEWLHESEISVLHVVPSRGRTWLRTAPAGLPLPRLRLTFFAGEPLTRDLAQTWHGRTGGTGLTVNLYGPTETTLVKTAYRVPEDAGRGDGVLPVGHPLPQTQVMVLNGAGNLAGLCEIGEVAIRTPFRSFGYINPNGDQSSRFVANPFRHDPQDLIYYTGDIGRFRPSGELEILGRADDQVKILGLRIEPAEVSAALGEHPEVGACHVLARMEADELFLVAYVLPTASAQPSAAELRRFLAQRLPAAMVPRYFVTLDQLPLTPNGKIDRSALPPPATNGGPAAKLAVPPRNATEERVVDIWRSVLGVPTVGVTDDFFELGGHSLLAAMIVTQAAAAFGVDIKIRTLFEAPTVAEFAAHIGGETIPTTKHASGSHEPSHSDLDETTVECAPLSFAQERLWFLDQLERERAVYNMSFGWRLRGELDIPSLRRALETVVHRHEPLRTAYVTRSGIPLQAIHPTARFELPVVDLAHLSGERQETEVTRRYAEDAERGFDLTTDLMLRASLLRLGRVEHVLLLTMHHIASDGWSFAVFWRELKELYRAYRRGEPAALPDLEVRYVDYAIRQREQLKGDRIEQPLKYWRAHLEGLSTLQLPTDRPRPQRPNYRGARHDFELDTELVSGLKQLSRAEAATLNMTLLAAFQGLLGRETAQEDLAVGIPIAGRDRPELAHLIGFFVNTLVIRTDLSGTPSFRTLLQRVRQVSLDAYDHRELPFDKLVAELRPERQRGRNPLVQVVFQLHDGWVSDVDLDGIDLSWLPKRALRARFDLEMHLRLHGDGLRGTVVYSSELFDAETIEGLVSRFTRLLQWVVVDPDRPVNEVPLLSSTERQHLLVQWNDTAAAYPLDRRIHQLFEEQVARTPGAVAVQFGNESVTYRELNHRADQLAMHLARWGVEPGSLVGVCLDRSLQMIVAVLGILKAGAAYLPLDPAFPGDRLSLMVSDAEVSAVLSDSALAASFPALGERVIPMDLLGPANGAPERGGPGHGEGREDDDALAYVMYTSGSSGKPKGVRVPHRCVVNFLLSMQERPGLTAEDVVLAVTTLSFDISVLEIFLPLITGARVVPVDTQTASDGRRLAAVIEACGATVMQATPSTWRMLVDAGWTGSRRLKALAGGESLPPQLAKALRERVAQLWNMYGPTETTVWSACGEVTDDREPIGIGRPIANTQIYVLDAGMQPVPIGLPGEVYIGGAGVTDGYLKREDLTARHFVPNPFANGAGGLLYRTGDRGRWREDGQLEVLGRVDRQLKIRGHRVEPGEIEAALALHPAVNACAVEPSGAGDVALTAFVVYRDELTLPTNEIRGFLARTLPSYMLPQRVVPLSELPLLPNGKIDRKALRAREVPPVGSPETYVAPRTATEWALAGIWGEALGLSRVGVTDDFFELGGHSLLIADVVAKMRDVLGGEITLDTLFEHSTIATLVAAVGRTTTAASATMPDGVPQSRKNPLLVPIHVGSVEPPLIFIHAAGGIVSPYVQLANRLDPRETFYGIEHPGIHGSPVSHSIPELAARYLDVIREAQPDGPYLLGGWSFGGLVAYEVAQQLLQGGGRVHLLAVLDSFLPGVVSLHRGPAQMVRTYLRHYGLPEEAIACHATTAVSASMDEALAGAHEDLRRRSLVPAQLHLNAFMEHYAVYSHAIEATRAYVPSPDYPGQVTLFRSASRVRDRGSAHGWAELNPSQLVVRDVPGDHFHMLREPFVATLAQELQSLLNRSRINGATPP